MKNKGGVISGKTFCLLSFILNFHVALGKTTECPEYWVKIGTGCYLFAIPEILEMDGSCRLDGNYWYWNLKMYRILI